MPEEVEDLRREIAALKARLSSNPGNMGINVIILDASDLPVAKEIPAGLEGLPLSEEIDDESKPTGKDAKGNTIFAKKTVPIAYYLKEALRTPAPDKRWALRSGVGRDGRPIAASGQPVEFDLSKEDIDDTARNFKERAAAGIKPFIPDTHVDYRDAAANNGEIIDAYRRQNPDGTHSLMTKLKVIGTRGQEKVLKNDVSVYLVDGNDHLVVDAFGKKYKGRVLHHLALTPNPNQPHLEPFQRIAASADGADPRDVPVYRYVDRLALAGVPMCNADELAAAKDHLTSMGEDTSDLKPENAVGKLIAHGKKMKTASDGVAMKHNAAKAVMALSAEAELEPAVKAVVTERDKLKTDLKAAEDAKALALSGDPASLTPWNLSAFEMNASTLREACIKSGKVSASDARAFDSIWRDKAGKPTRIGLSATCDNGHPAELNFWRTVLGLSDTIRTQAGTTRHDGTTVADPAIALDATAAREGHPQPEKRRDEIMEEARRITGGKPSAA